MRLFSILLVLMFPLITFAQKQVYIPNEWSSGNFDYSMERSAESENFVIFWGPLAGMDPTQAPGNIAFDPAMILETAEDLYKFYVDSLVFVSDSSGLLSEWKMILVILHTWEGVEGWAFGGNYDGVTGAMWMHPHAASDGTTLAHEFTHALQNYTWMMYPGHGFINNSYVGFFWEAHAEFMAMQYYPEVALNFDMSRWMNTAQYHWSSTRHHYQAFIFLQFIKEMDGLELINRMWRESLIGEHPLQTYMRLTGRDQQALNDLFGNYAMRNVVWDYDNGEALRERTATIPEKFRLHATLIPDVVDADHGLYQIQDYRAPQDYGYNHIRLFPVQRDSCEETIVQIRFRGYEVANPDAGWRWGLVAVNQEGVPRYSDLMRDDDELVFTMDADEEALYLVVSGAPKLHHNYIWEAGFPRIYRYPYAFKVEGAVPEGFQPGYSRVPEGVVGSPHPNGGGFVAATATVSPTAWVDATATVLDQAMVSDDARIEGYALVQHQARIGDSARVGGYAMVGENARVEEQGTVEGHARIWGGTHIYGDALVSGHSALYYTDVYDTAIVTDNTFCWGAELHGTVHLGGDAEFFRPCDAGIYLQVQGAYNRECDGLDDHPANESLNGPYLGYDATDLLFEEVVDCGGTSFVTPIMALDDIRVYPNPGFGFFTLDSENMAANHAGVWALHNLLGAEIQVGNYRNGERQALAFPGLNSGLYYLRLRSGMEVRVIPINLIRL